MYQTEKNTKVPKLALKRAYVSLERFYFAGFGPIFVGDTRNVENTRNLAGHFEPQTQFVAKFSRNAQAVDVAVLIIQVHDGPEFGVEQRVAGVRIKIWQHLPIVGVQVSLVTGSLASNDFNCAYSSRSAQLDV